MYSIADKNKVKTVSTSLPDDLYEWAVSLAEKRALNVGNNNGVTTLIRMALKSYLSKYHSEYKTQRGEENDGED